MFSACNSSLLRTFIDVRSAVEQDYLPASIGERFNIAEGVGALCYQPCLFFLSKSIRLFETGINSWQETAKRAAAVAMVALTSVLAATGCVVKRIGAFFPRDRTPKTDAVIERTLPEKIDQIYELMSEFSQVAHEIGLDYRMISGTALGARRHGGIIPWDDDGDFAIMEAEKNKIKRALADGTFARHGLEVQFCPTLENFQIRFMDRRRGTAPKAALDLFLLKKSVTENPEFPVRIEFLAPCLGEHFPHEFFTEEEWNTKEEWTFGPKGRQILLTGMGQGETEQYLKRAYGDDCMTCGLKTHRHMEIVLPGFRFSAFAIPVVTREKVSLVDFRPAFGIQWHE